MQEFTITDNKSKQEFVCREKEYILYAMQRTGKTCIPIGCKGGGCGVCRITIISGTADYGRMSNAHITEEQRKNGYALACRLMPKSDLVVEYSPKTNTSINRGATKEKQQNEVSQ